MTCEYFIYIGIFIYWLLGVIILIHLHRKDFDLRIGGFILISLFLWFAWPIILLSEVEFPVLFKRYK